MSNKKPVIGITMGDPAGIGPEICVKALLNNEVEKTSRPIVIGDASVIRKTLKIFKLETVKVLPISKIEDAVFETGILNVFDLDNVDATSLKPGEVSAAAGKAAIEYIETAIDLALAKKIDAITTGPINKEAIHKAGFKYQGHTELLAERTNTKNYAMMFVSPSLWVMLVTTHIPLKEVSRHISRKKVLNTIKLAHTTLSGLRRRAPKIGVAGLNPHAGESGIFGNEEKKHIIPAVEDAKKLGIKVEGPLSPDAIFYLANVGMFDIVIAMYHDQGLIPLKLLSFNRSVNVTAGLPIVRTSVDHGTGFDIVGKGWANPQSMIEAAKVAALIVKSKKHHK